jgi:3-dehydroquinate dehydratase/shikimate dehydrogenase
MAKICLCLTGKTILHNLEILEKYREHIDIAELRVDCLDPEEFSSIRRFPGLAGLPVILTVRRKVDGGFFSRGEAARLLLLGKGLAFAQDDRRQNFAYVDLEEDLDIPSLEEVARAYGTRIIRSFHNFAGTDIHLKQRIEKLFRIGDEIAKAAVTAQSAGDVCQLVNTAKELREREFIMISMGDIGQCTRILTAKFGGYLTYVSAPPEDGTLSAAPGHIDPVTLTGLYRFRSINADTAVYGITGFPLTTTLSPAFHNEVFEREKLNAVYARFPAENIGSFMNLADALGLSGASITVPHKESVLRYLSAMSEEVRVIGACNTIVRTENGWMGYNTDAEGFSGSLLNALNRKHCKRMKACVIGAGGASRAVAAELRRLGASALILNRNEARAKELAAAHRFESAALAEGVERRVRKFSDIIVQTTSAGMEGDTEKDPLPWYQFSGREAVMDLIYKPESTRFLSRARAAGCTALNGFDMLERQAKRQFERFFGREYPEAPKKK